MCYRKTYGLQKSHSGFLKLELDGKRCSTLYIASFRNVSGLSSFRQTESRTLVHLCTLTVRIVPLLRLPKNLFIHWFTQIYWDLGDNKRLRPDGSHWAYGPGKTDRDRTEWETDD